MGRNSISGVGLEAGACGGAKPDVKEESPEMWSSRGGDGLCQGAALPGHSCLAWGLLGARPHPVLKASLLSAWRGGGALQGRKYRGCRSSTDQPLSLHHLRPRSEEHDPEGCWRLAGGRHSPSLPAGTRPEPDRAAERGWWLSRPAPSEGAALGGEAAPVAVKGDSGIVS